MRKAAGFLMVFGLALLAGSCTLPGSGGEGEQQELLGDPLEAPLEEPQAPEGLSVDGEGDQDQQDPAAEPSQLPGDLAAAELELFPADWTLAEPIQICPAQELTLYGVSYLDNGLMMVSFVDPFLAGGSSQAADFAELPIFLESYTESGDLQASYDCSKHPETPNLVYCYGEALPAGSLALANLAYGEPGSVAIYDLTGSISPAGDEPDGNLLLPYSDLDTSLLFPAYFGYNRDFLAEVWDIQGTVLDPDLDLTAVNQAAAGMGFKGEVKTMVGLFNILSACQIAADLGSPLPEGCQELGSDYYQPQTNCQSFSACYQACSTDLGFVSPGGEHSLSRKELLDYLEENSQAALPPSCTDYQYWSRSAVYSSSSGETGEPGESGGTTFPGNPLSGQCLLDSGNPLCTGEFWEDDSDQETGSIPSEVSLPQITVACIMDPDNPFCSGEFPMGGSEQEGAAFSLCAADIAWKGWDNTYGGASKLLTYLLSVGPSLDQEALPASCQAALAQTGSEFVTGLGGVLSGVIYSGTINSCTYQAAFVVPADGSAGGSGGGQPGPSKPDCGPGLIAVEWQGGWICIPEN